jgi:NTE family protein
MSKLCMASSLHTADAVVTFGAELAAASGWLEHAVSDSAPTASRAANLREDFIGPLWRPNLRGGCELVATSLGAMTVAFVLGGGGVRGAVEVGMIRALLERGIVPDLVVGTSIGAINGAAVAADPTMAVVEHLEQAWGSPTASAVYGDSWWRQMQRLAQSRTHLNDPAPLRALLESVIGADARFDDLKVPLAVCASSIERAAEVWFDSGPVIDAVLASASVPAALPPTLINGEHYVDGGIVNSIPVGQAARRGATTIFVLQVGRVEEPLSVPTKPSEVARVSFEIARRHRFARELAEMPPGVDVHVLPYGGPQPEDDKLGSYRKFDATHRRMLASYEASAAYLDRLG